jgi:predicted site-specific integrase-resolvase
LVKEVVVMHKDRLCRFGSKLLELVFNTLTSTPLLIFTDIFVCDFAC